MHTLDKLKAKHPTKIDSWYKDPDGYWVELKYGWQFFETHGLHGHTVKEVLDDFRAVTPCECLSCRTHGEQWEDFDIDTGKMVVHHRSAST